MASEESVDIFDNILLADDMFRGEGYRDGYAQGACRGLMGGRRHGTSHGARLSNEFNFYHGFASTWKYLLQQNTDTKSRKRLKVLESLLCLIQECPLDDPQSATLQSDAEKIRAKFRQLLCRFRIMSQQMDNSHRKFLQGMMTNGIVDEQTAKKLYQQCCDTYKTTCLPDKLNDFIDTINSKLQPMFMQIRTGKSEENGQQHYALVNMDETNISCMSSDYPDYELEIFKKTMELIVCSETGQVSSTEILNTTDTMKVKKLKKSETEQLLKRLVREKWLTEKHGEYCLSTRCVIEMEPYIRTMYQEQVNVCHICHNIAIQCQTCENPTCSIKIHKPCVARYFKNKRQPCCPACDDSWPHEIPATHRPRSSQSK